MATFTFTPDFELEESSEPRVRKTQFMDGGYEHRLRFGLNTNLKTYQLVFKNRPDSERDQILAFFNDMGGAEAFDWTGVNDRRNLFSYTEDFTRSVWSQTNLTIIGGGYIGYTGGSNAFGIIPNATNGLHILQYINTVAANTNTTTSLYVKQLVGRDVQFQVFGTTNFHGLTLNFSTGIATFNSGGSVTTVDWGASKVNAEWWRIWVTGRPDSGTVRDMRIVTTNASGATTYSGNGTTANLIIMGPQMEYGGLTGYQPILTPPAPTKWVCEKWDSRWLNCNNNTITATFRQVAES